MGRRRRIRSAARSVIDTLLGRYHTRAMPPTTPGATSDSTGSAFASPYRTHSCGELRASDAGREARLAGWVHRRRDHGQLIFLDLRDRHGITQVVVDRTEAPEAHAAASRVRSEYVVATAGEVQRRDADKVNARLPTGEIEVRASAVEVL